MPLVHLHAEYQNAEYQKLEPAANTLFRSVRCPMRR